MNAIHLRVYLIHKLTGAFTEQEQAIIRKYFPNDAREYKQSFYYQLPDNCVVAVSEYDGGNKYVKLDLIPGKLPYDDAAIECLFDNAVRCLAGDSALDAINQMARRP